MRLFLAVLSLLLLAACRGGDATALYFTEQEPGAGAATTRMLLTDRYLRIDYGADEDDFILFDRREPAIYSVNHSDKTILVISPLAVNLDPPTPFTHEVAKDDEAYPEVAGKKVTHYRLLTNAKQCYDVFAADGLLPQAVQALREYHATIAGEHAAAMRNTPKDVRSACDLANFIFLPARHLEFGFPIRQVDMAGNVRQLVDYKQGIGIDAKLFELPQGFRRFRTGEMRGELGS